MIDWFAIFNYASPWTITDKAVQVASQLWCSKKNTIQHVNVSSIIVNSCAPLNKITESNCWPFNIVIRLYSNTVFGSCSHHACSSACFSAYPWFPSFSTDVHAALSGYKVVAASSTTWIDELLTHPGGWVVVVARYRCSTPSFIQGIQAEHRSSCQAHKTTIRTLGESRLLFS